MLADETQGTYDNSMITVTGMMLLSWKGCLLNIRACQVVKTMQESASAIEWREWIKGWAFEIVLQTCFRKKSNMPPISPTYTCCSLRYWVDVRGDSIVATCSEVSGWSRWSSKIQQDCGKAVETSWRLGVGKSYSFLSSAAFVIEYPDRYRYHLLYIYYISFLPIW